MKACSSPSRLLRLALAGLLVFSTTHVPRLAAQAPGVGSGDADAIPPAARRIARPALDQMLALAPTARSIRQAPAFRIVVVRGDGAINNISQRTAGEPIVEIRDENDNPVGGVAVTFLIPEGGAGGTFANGETSLTVVTDANGQAAGTGLSPNTTQGPFEIQVSATVQQQTLTAAITQTNTLTGVLAGVGGGISTKMILILAAIGGAAAAGTAVALSGGDNGDNGPAAIPVVLQPGSPTVGPPPQ